MLPLFYYISACHTTIVINISDIGESILTNIFYDFSIRFWNCSDIVVFVCFSLYLTLYTSLTHPLFTRVVCRRAHVLFTYLCLLAHSGVQHKLSFLFCLSSSCMPNVASFSGLFILDCHFGFSNVQLTCSRETISYFYTHNSCLCWVFDCFQSYNRKHPPLSFQML